MLKMYAKTENMIDLLYDFTTRQWKFENNNTRKLWLLLSKEDRNTFYYSLENYDWEPYLKSYYFGIRKHLLHEDESNIGEAKKKNQKYDFTQVHIKFFHSIVMLSFVFRLFWLHHLSICLMIYVVFQLYSMFKNI